MPLSYVRLQFGNRCIRQTLRYGPETAELTADDAHRRVSEWVVNSGGRVWIPGGWAAKLDDLPDTDFVVTVVSLDDCDVKDEELKIFQDIDTLQQISFGSAAITDAAVELLRHNRQLRSLSVTTPDITDRGAALLAEFSELTNLQLMTQLTDAGGGSGS